MAYHKHSPAFHKCSKPEVYWLDQAMLHHVAGFTNMTWLCLFRWVEVKHG